MKPIWIDFYMEFADALLAFRHDRQKLLEMVEGIFASLHLRYPFCESNGEKHTDACPFTVMGCFNKGIKDANRIAIASAFKKRLKLKAAVPDAFDGIPVLNNMKSFFFSWTSDTVISDIENNWTMFETSLKHADHPTRETRKAFIEYFNKVIAQPNVKWTLTMGLYWIRPMCYLNLDSTNRALLKTDDVLREIAPGTQMPDGNMYLHMVEACEQYFVSNNATYHAFWELSAVAWKKAHVTAPNQSDPLCVGEDAQAARRVWLYAPGEGARLWDDCVQKGILSLGWDELGNLQGYPDKNAIQERLIELNEGGSNAAYACWQFANEIQIGDIVYAKKGLSQLVGRGIVRSEYKYDPARAEHRNIREAEWTHNRTVAFPAGQLPMKTLTDITARLDYQQMFDTLFEVDSESAEIRAEMAKPTTPYGRDEFLGEVFLPPERFARLAALLTRKKNVIIQGAPGAGKTFAAKRLAYAMMGERDDSRVHMVQFHQSYTYEDFIMGYRPTANGFELQEGPFYRFCEKARGDGRDHYFIIDEINRGNLSKIFGELMMLIEPDKRETPLTLLYRNETFSVPSNLYIIGLMNTADRSLALIDYALRRRFAFFDFEPAFDSEGFKALMENAGCPQFDKLISVLKQMNQEIAGDAALGKGFRIGHGYFGDQPELIDEGCLRDIVEYELIPLIEQYWYDREDKAGQWSERLRGAING